jgi:hypothetical protein
MGLPDREPPLPRTSEYYREKAEEVRLKSETTISVEGKEACRWIAEIWNRLADSAE